MVEQTWNNPVFLAFSPQKGADTGVRVPSFLLVLVNVGHVWYNFFLALCDNIAVVREFFCVVASIFRILEKRWIMELGTRWQTLLHLVL